MKRRFPGSLVPPAGPVLSLLLIGLVLLSGLLYYRAVKIQRFLEPALAMSQPRNEFYRRIHELFLQEFGAATVPGLQVRSGSLLLHRSLLFAPDNTLKPAGKRIIRKIARIFHALLREPATRESINTIAIITRYPPGGTPERGLSNRVNVQLMAAVIREALFQAEPELGRKYADFFTAGSQLLNSPAGGTDFIEYRIIPSEFLHIEVLERLEKYAY